jgi:LEA14-like dessication related protein
MLLRFAVERDGKEIGNGWALNEVTVERDGTTMVELFVEIDNRPLSHWAVMDLSVQHRLAPQPMHLAQVARFYGLK